MRLEIRDGKVKGVPFVTARCSGGPIKPELIIVHDTAGRLDKGNSVKWFQSAKCETSAHFVIERDGTIIQMVRCDRKAFHAGQSTWEGRKFCNSFSIGIEIVNPGKLDKDGKAYFGKATTDPISRKKTKEHGDGYWLDYTPEQIEATKALCRAIMIEYPDCNEVTTHWAVSPGRKIDTNPLFPLSEIQDYASGNDDAEDVDIGSGADYPPATMPEPAVDAGGVSGSPQVSAPKKSDTEIQKDLAATSSKWFMTKVMEIKGLILAVMALFGITLDDPKAVDVNSIGGAAHKFNEFWASYGLIGLALIGFTAIVFASKFQGKMVKDTKEGRYTPSGAAQQ
ncbi:MAG: N-acetylmuramoyl-L-alanine amidase [Beijerinckiaceae bacterium]